MEGQIQATAYAQRMSKNHPLFVGLNGQNGDRINATMQQIEGVLGFDLPVSARTYSQWWENDQTHTQAKAWLEAGFHTEQVNLTAGTFTFVRF